MIKRSVLNSIERKFILLVGDLIIAFVAINFLVSYGVDEKYVSLDLKFWMFGIGVFTYLFLSYVLDFYNLEKIARRRYVLSQSIYIGSLFVFVVFISAVILFDASFWRIPLLSFLILTPLQIVLWRLFFSNMFKIIPVTKKVLFLYDESTSDVLQRNISKIDGEGVETFYRVKLTFSSEQHNSSQRKWFLSAADKIDALIVNVSSYDSLPKNLQNMLLEAILKGKEVISFTSFYENVYEALPIRSNNDSFYEILHLKNKKIRYLQAIFSFLVNFFLSFFVGIIFVVSVPFIWFLNLFFNKGPLFYTQVRVGQYGKEFKIYKFRSMIVDAEKTGAKMASKNDTRITPFGKVLRAFRFDELPQIISVMKGHMHFIGPRPERKVFVDELNQIIPFYNCRHLVKPGITGWAQVKYKYGENLDQPINKLEYDLYYIKNKSIMLDLRIVFKTITTVIFSRGV